MEVLRRAALLALVLLGGSLLVLGVIKFGLHTKQEQTTENPPVARVYNRYLYRNDLAHLKTESNSAEGDADIIEQYIQNWISKQLLIAEAETCNDYDKADMERRFLDYRYALLVHSFIEKLVNNQLNREVSQKEITEYYQTHQENFILRSNIFKGKFIVLPKDSPCINKLSTLFVGKSEKQLQELKDCCLQYAKNYVIDETAWLPWDELTQNVTFGGVLDKTKVLSKRKLIQVSDDDQLYYFKISEYRLVGEISPIEFVKDRIIDIILYKRKIELVDKIKKDLLQQAKKNNHCVIYEH